MWRSELVLMFGRLRTRVMLLVLTGIPVLLVVILRLAARSRPGEGPAFFGQVTQNGVFAALVGLTAVVPFFLPLAVGIVAGDSVAGEANLGTLRYLLTRPVGRTRLLVTKYVASAVFCLAAAVVVAVGGLVAGAALFPIGRVTTLSGDTLSIGAGTLRMLLAALVVGSSMFGLAAVGLFISTVTDIPVAAMAATALIALFSELLDAVPQLSRIHGVLVTHYWLSFGDLLRSPIRFADIDKGLVLQLGYTVVFGLAAWARFTTRDVLS